jgi:probable rRNA maturation factor
MIVFDVPPRLPSALTGINFPALGVRLAKALKLRSEREVGLRFVSEAEIQRLNRLYRKKNRPTDVLSFEPAPGPGVSSRTQFGDLVICPVYASREAKRRSIEVREELVRLLVHGVLHLAGYDHATEAEEATMFALQERLVEETCQAL